MIRFIFYRNTIIALFFVSILYGCSSQQVCAIRYDLVIPAGTVFNRTYVPTVTVSNKELPLNVQLARFSDTRPPEEKFITARSGKSKLDLSFYTFDDEFAGNVAEGISKMVVEHLNYSKVFKNNISIASFASDSISDSILDSLHISGIDALILGNINHFYGYLERDIGREIFYGTIGGLGTGFFLAYSFISGNYWYLLLEPFPSALALMAEGWHKRDIKYATELTTRIISTSTHKVLWEGSFKISDERRGTMSVLIASKYNCALFSLRDVVDKIVDSLSTSDIKLK